jgi:hypothetical protein
MSEANAMKQSAHASLRAERSKPPEVAPLAAFRQNMQIASLARNAALSSSLFIISIKNQLAKSVLDLSEKTFFLFLLTRMNY